MIVVDKYKNQNLDDVIIIGNIPNLSSMTSVFNPALFKGKLALISGGATGICY